MKLRHLLSLGVGLTVGCGEAPGVVEPSIPAGTEGLAQFNTLPEDRYPTEDEFAAAGGLFAVIHPTPTGSFASGTWKSSATVGWRWANYGAAKLTGTLINDGGHVNSQEHPFSFGHYRPVISYDVPLNVAASTLNHVCGLTGKVSLQASAELWLLRFQIGAWKPLLMFEYNQTKNGTEVSQPSCPVEIEDEIVWPESGMPCDTPWAEGCTPPSGGGIPPYPYGGSAPSGGESGQCMLHWRRESKSRDGGYTWIVESEQYWWQCW